VVGRRAIYGDNWDDGDLDAIAINPSTGDIWAIGTYAVVQDDKWIRHAFIAILDRDLRVKKTLDYPPGSEVYSFWFEDIGFDKDGNAYITTSDLIAKFDKYGNLLKVRKGIGGKVFCLGDKIFIFDDPYLDGYWRHVVYVLDKELNVLNSQILSSGNWHATFSRGRVAFDGRNFYVAGRDHALGNNTRWVIYSLSVFSRVVVQVVDGFGRSRDWPVEVVGVASGSGWVEVDLVAGLRYTARSMGLNFTNATEFTASGPQTVVTIKIPTAVVKAEVIDGFGQRRDWPIEIVGVATGRSHVEAEVIAGRHVVKTTAFGKEFTQDVTVGVGRIANVVLRIPTAKLSVVVVDEGGATVGQVESVEVDGPTSFTSTTPPRGAEVLAGQYTVKVKAFGREATATATIGPGEVKTVKVVVPATQSQPTAASPTTPEAVTTPTATQTATTPQSEPTQQPATSSSPPTPPPPPTDFLLMGVAVATVAIAGVLTVARLRVRRAEARKAQPTTQTVTQPRVSETSAVGDFCLEYQGGVIPLAEYTVVGRGDFSGLPERVLEMIEERHFAVYYEDGEWWVEDLGSRRGTYLNGVRVKRERLREGDVISPGAAVAVVFKRCRTARRVVPMEEEGTKTY